MYKYEFIVRYALYSQDWRDGWYVDKEKVTITAENIYSAKFKAIDYVKQKLKGRNPELDEALLNNFYTDVKMIF